MRDYFTQKRGRCSGQAVIEFCVGLIVLLLLVIGMVHIHKMAVVSLGIHSEIRGEAGQMAMQSTLGHTPEAISDWDPGPDKLRYTADDKAQVSGMASLGIIGTLVGYSARNDDDWRVTTDRTQLPVSMVRLRDQMGLPFFLGSAYETDTERVRVDPFLRQLVLGKEEVKIKEEVWIPLMGGLY